MAGRSKLGIKFPRQLLVSLFVGAFAVSIILGSAESIYTQGTPPTPREVLVQDIKESARRHFKLGNAQNVTDRFEERGKHEGISKEKIAEIYETEFLRLKQAKAENLWERIRPSIGWIAAGLLFFGLIFKETLTKWLTSFIEKVGEALYNKLAGTTLIQGIALRRYQKALIAKHQQLHIPFRPNQPLKRREIYVPLKVAGGKDSEQIGAQIAVATYHRLMVKGPPGSGKSMLLRYLALSYAEGNFAFLDDRPVPILLELHRLSEADLTLGQLEQKLVDALDRDGFPKANRFIGQGLKRGSLLLLLDGLDEVNSSVRVQVCKAIKDLLAKPQYSKCRAIITCRTAVYNNEFANAVAQTLEIVEFSDSQIEQFLRTWAPQMPPHKSIAQLMQALTDRPGIKQLARNPLLLTIIAYLYTDTPFVLPHSRAEFYQKSTDVLLEQWNQARQTPNAFRARDKRLVLQALALYNQETANQRQQDRRSMTYQEVLQQVKQVLPDLNLKGSAKEILQEVVERSGLLLAIDRGERYQFSHLTLQEFFAAAELLTQQDELVQQFKADPGAWRETVKLWCGLANDSTRLIQQIYEVDKITAFECLADAKKVDEDAANHIIEEFKVRLFSKQEESVINAFGTLAADQRERGRGETVFKVLAQTLADDSSVNKYTTAAQALAKTNLPRAVKILAGHYHERAMVREPLVSMGNLAIPGLVKCAEKQVVEALEDVFNISTTDAAVALVPFLWHENQTLASHAAWYLAQLLLNSEIERSLRGCSLEDEYRKENYIDWIWQPFADSRDESLGVIAGRIVYLIIHFDEALIETKQKQLDPRLIVPICMIELREEVGKLNPWRTEADVLLEQRSVDVFLQEKLRKEVDRLLQHPTIKWDKLLATLTPRTQLDLLRRLINERKASIRDWQNLKRKVNYEFKTEWHYQVILFVAFSISIISLIEMSYKFSQTIDNYWWSGIYCPAILIVIVFWSFMWQGIEEQLEPNLFIQFGLQGIVQFWREQRRLIRSRLIWVGAEPLSEIIDFSGILAGILLGASVGILIGILLGILTLYGLEIKTSASIVIIVCTLFGCMLGIFGSALVEILALNKIAAEIVVGSRSRSKSSLSSKAEILALTLILVVAVFWLEAGTGILAAATSLLIFTGLVSWSRAKKRQDWVRFLAILAFPLFCWFPITLFFASIAFLRFLTWPQLIIGWVVIFGAGTWLWKRGQALDYTARNPLQGILDDYSKRPVH